MNLPLIKKNQQANLTSVEERFTKELDRLLEADLANPSLVVSSSSGFTKIDPLKSQAYARGLKVACGCEKAFNSHNHTYFSVLDGISSPEAMVSSSARNGWQAMGISDHGSMGGNLKAGGAAKKWQTARVTGGKLVNFEEISFDPSKPYPLKTLFESRSFSNKRWERYSAEEQTAIIGSVSFTSGSEEPMVFVLAESALNDIVVADQSLLSRAVRLSDLRDDHKFIINGRKSTLGLNLKTALKGLVASKNKITYNPSRPDQCILLDSADIVSVMPFKVISGVELYVSWAKDHGKRYNHITCYATGIKGHEALVLLTSIGSISSRRYVGERGFYRPRVFVEDIALAVAEAQGELVVTSGCPISITSEALRRGDMASAEAFFTWATETLPKGRFFAELHLCDVSMDYNRLHPKADGKFYSQILGTPISRMRHLTVDDALAHAKNVQSDLIKYVLSVGSISMSYGNEVPLADRLYDTDMYRKTDSETLAQIDSLITTGNDRFFEKYGIVLPKQDQSIHDAAQSLSASSIKTIEEAMDVLVESENVKAGVSKRKRKSSIPVVDEDTAAILDLLIKTNRDIKAKDSKISQGMILVSGFCALVLSKLIRDENVKIINPARILADILTFIAKSKPTDNNQSLLAIAEDRALFLDARDDESIQELFNSGAAAIINHIYELSSMDSSAGIKGASEDDLEKEFLQGRDGNWMVEVNRGLVQLAKKFDVPLLVASDAHMSSIELKPIQDALLKNGERRRWHFSRPYAVPSAHIPTFIDDVGRDYSQFIDCDVKTDLNIVQDMIDKKALALSDIVESFGSGSLLLDDAQCVSTFKWKPAPPKIDYTKHPLYAEAEEWLSSGALREFLPKIGSGSPFEFSDKSVIMSTALLVVLFFKSMDRGDIPNTEEYVNRILSELHLQQELPPQQLADFFLVLQYSLKRFRDAGVSVGPGRGSSGGMLTAYISGITFGDPIKNKFLESRWMNRGRKQKGDSDADIDIDVDDRQVAGFIFAQVAKEAAEAEKLHSPLSPLESILLPEMFYSSPSLTHSQIVNKLESSRQDKDDNLANDDARALEVDKNDPIVFGSPIIRVGTYMSLKAKAAVKEAIRMTDESLFEELPSFGSPTSQWLTENKDSIRGLTESERNERYEEAFFSHLSLRERTDRRRVRLAEQISEEMKIGSGMARLYSGPTSEYDFFMGSVYGVCPDYWDRSFPPPGGSSRAAYYFDQNPAVKAMALDFLNIYKNVSVHAGGFCIGRELLRRVPLRVDKHGFVSQYEMKDIEKVRVLKFDILGLNTLTLIKESLRMWVNETADATVPEMIPEDVWTRVKGGESTDYLWPFLPLSTPEATDLMCKNRSTIFQIDTQVYGKELSRLQPHVIKDLVAAKGGDARSNTNYELVNILSAFLALFRPGPMKSNSHALYIDRLSGAPFELAYKWMEPFVMDTMGVIAYQEQVMSMFAAGVMIDPAAEIVDEVRRAMGKKDIKALREMQAQEKFEAGLATQGVDQVSAKAIWAIIEPFAEYGFNLPHSYHYGIISAMTLWSKAHNFKNWFKTTMANSKPEEVARFLGEIANPRAVCVIRSEDFLWSYVGQQCYQGIANIAGLQEKDIIKIGAAKRGSISALKNRRGLDVLKDSDLKQVSVVDFFLCLGAISEGLASKLAKSGSLRIFGTKSDIARGFAAAAVSRKESDKVAKKKLKLPSVKIPKSEDKDDLLSSLLPVTLGEKPSLETPIEADVIDGTAMAHDLFDSMSLPDLLSLLNKDDRDTVSIFSSSGYTVAWPDGDQIGRFRPKDGILSTESALDMIKSNKTRGLGVRWYVFAMHEQSLREKVRLDILLLSEMVKFQTIDGLKIIPKETYVVPAFVGGVFSGKNFRTGETEYKVSLLADGTSVSAKFAKNMPPEKVEDLSKLLKDEKMLSMLVFVLEPNVFKDRETRRDVSYYIIHDVVRPSEQASSLFNEDDRDQEKLS